MQCSGSVATGCRMWITLTADCDSCHHSSDRLLVVRLSFENGERAVELLQEDHPCQLVRQGQLPERKNARAGREGAHPGVLFDIRQQGWVEPLSAANEERQLARPHVHEVLQALGQFVRRDLLTSGVEQDARALFEPCVVSKLSRGDVDDAHLAVVLQATTVLVLCHLVVGLLETATLGTYHNLHAVSIPAVETSTRSEFPGLSFPRTRECIFVCGFPPSRERRAEQRRRSSGW